MSNSFLNKKYFPTFEKCREIGLNRHVKYFAFMHGNGHPMNIAQCICSEDYGVTFLLRVTEVLI